MLAAILVAAVTTPVDARRKGASGKDSELAGWIEGPVRYIALPEEREQFRALDDDGARALYVERFWARRDPNPDTLVNEYRTLFWERVQQANDTLLDAPRPGWMTDRGKIYILYGPPNEIQDYHDLETDAGPTASRGLIRWLYERPAGRMDMDAIVVVPFVRDVTGEYRVSYDPKLASVFLDDWAIRDKRQQQMDDLLTALGGFSRESELSVMLDLGKMQEVPPAEKVLLERVDTIETYRAEPLAVEIDRFRRPGRDGMWCVVTVRLDDADASRPPALLARFRRSSGGEERILGEATFKFETTGDGTLLAQSRVELDDAVPWSAMVVAARPGSAVTSVFRGDVRPLPDRAALHLSDVVIADRIEPVEVRALATWEEPYHLGPYRVVPAPSPVLHPGEALELLYEVYGGSPPYTVSYRLEGREDDGRWVELGRPSTRSDDNPVQGWQLTTAPTWPEGDYRVLVDVRDAAGNAGTTEVPFRLGPDADAGTADATLVPR